MHGKSLILIRHAKSSWKDTSLVDRQRPLNKRGHRNASEMAEKLANKERCPDTIISSPAKRAVHTAHYFAGALDYALFDIQIDERLYFCGLKGYLKTLRELPEECHSLMLIGHNPELTELVEWLSPFQCEALSTSCIVRFSLPIPVWSELEAETGKLDYIWSPKQALTIVDDSDTKRSQGKLTLVKD